MGVVRVCFYTDESFFDPSRKRYVVARFEVGERGFEPRFSRRELDDARRVADEMNTGMGISDADVSEIVDSAMRMRGAEPSEYSVRRGANREKRGE